MDYKVFGVVKNFW